MSSIGPQLPPHLSKRSRSPSSDHSPHRTKHPRRAQNDDEIALDASDSASDSDSHTPAKPTTTPNADKIPLPSESDSSSSSSSDDDFGPSLPSATAPRRVAGPSLPSPIPDDAPRRDEWMLAPPPASTFTERDPTRIRARKFASSTISTKPTPSSSSTSASASIWTETPEEKLRRLRDTVLGRAEKDVGAQDQEAQERKRAREERDRETAARIDAHRGRSLYEEHRAEGRGGGKRQNLKGRGGDDGEGEDDPSKRGFDRDKDMALGGRIGAAQRRELVSKSANFGGRFSKGSFL